MKVTMRFPATLTLLLLAVLVRAAPPPIPPAEIRNPLHVFQLFAKDVYPEHTEAQKQAVVTLSYLFQYGWEDQKQVRRIDEFLRSGGLNARTQTRQHVVVDDAVAHLQAMPTYQSVDLLRPALNTLIGKHLNAAKKQYKLKDALNTPRDPVINEAQGESPSFRGVPHAVTQEQLTAAMGGRYEAGGSSNNEQRGVRGFRGMIERLRSEYPRYDPEGR